ncbi:hypothetical protein MNBD_BACTEROID01-1900 [hydrothermal vent metagenome]|uniref:DUF4861 domain-containing protein n=1 Tax=hydrothermal vent metagenome TaxID=652676 RepID=A0A3B0TVA2_9ZZZZ
MDVRNFFIVALLFVVVACTDAQIVTFVNPLNIERADELVVLTKSQLAGEITLQQGMLPVFTVGGGFVSSQVDDLDGDGEWDEVALLLDFKPDEKIEAEVGFVTAGNYPEFVKRTNLRLGIAQEGHSYKEVDYYKAPACKDGFKIIAQGESVSWENDKIGFRDYFDCRNVKDLFGKLKPELIIDKIGTPEMGSYHKLADWGMDILHCGSSLGSGGIALMKDDSLYRLGSTETYEYQKITEGPVRSVFELRYGGWEVGGYTLKAVERISIYPGKYWFESDVTVTGNPEGSEIATGIVTSKLKKEPFVFDTYGWKCIGTHDVQSLNNDELGMAVIIPAKETGKIGRTSNTNFFKLGFQTVVEKGFSNIISETYYITQKCESGKPAKHYFFAVWGLDKAQWKTEGGFKRYISEEANKLSSKIKIYF